MQSLKQFDKLTALPFGISSNTVEQHAQFAKNHELMLPLLADPELKMISQYTGSKRFGNFSMAASRQSFLSDVAFRLLVLDRNFEKSRSRLKGERVITFWRRASDDDWDDSRFPSLDYT